MLKVTEKMNTVRKGSVLVLNITGADIVEGGFDNVKTATECAVRVGMDTIVDATAENVVVVSTILDDSKYGAGEGIRELLVKTGRQNAWLYPVSDLAKGYVEYDCQRKIKGKTEKFAVGLSFEAVIYDSMTEYKKTLKASEKGTKKALKPKKEIKEKAENATTAEVVA